MVRVGSSSQPPRGPASASSQPTSLKHRSQSTVRLAHDSAAFQKKCFCLSVSLVVNADATLVAIRYPPCLIHSDNVDVCRTRLFACRYLLCGRPRLLQAKGFQRKARHGQSGGHSHLCGLGTPAGGPGGAHWARCSVVQSKCSVV